MQKKFDERMLKSSRPDQNRTPPTKNVMFGHSVKFLDVGRTEKITKSPPCVRLLVRKEKKSPHGKIKEP